MLVIWLLVIILMIIILVLSFSLFQNQKKLNSQAHISVEKVEQQVLDQEQNLQKTLLIMQDLAKQLHLQQEVLEKVQQKVNQLESQQADLVDVLSKSIQAKH